MIQEDLYFEINSRLKIQGEDYVVAGLLSFRNYADDYKWAEYKIISTRSKEIKWLSVDNAYQEYALYTQCRYSKEFKEDNIIKEGYKKSDYGTAEVVFVNGINDTYEGDRVNYSEYEDESEDKIIAIEQWEDELEYSTGYYIEREEIIKTEEQGNYYSYSNYNDESSIILDEEEVEKPIRLENIKKIGLITFGIIILAVFFIREFGISFGSGTPMSKFIGASNSFEYTTSITSETEQNEKADVYTTNLSVEQASKAIIDGIDGDVEDVQENTDDTSVAIITKKEYCLIYTDDDNVTMVQVSSRLYTYSSSNDPYHSRTSTRHFYRNFYYVNGYGNDSTKYKGHSTSYENYEGGYVGTNVNDKYKSYSDSVRQSSAKSRSSSGGGTSAGK